MSELLAEQALLGSILSGYPELDEIVALVVPTDFEHPNHERIFGACAHIAATGGRCDPITVRLALGPEANQLPGGPTYLVELAQAAPTVASAPAYAAEVKAAAQRRRIAVAATAMHQLSETTLPLDQVADRARAIVDKATEERQMRAMQHISDVLPDVLQQAEEGRTGGLSTPWPDIDRGIAGVTPGRFTVVGSRPGVGKSLMGTNLALHMAHRHRKPVLLCSMEMPANEVTQRILAAHTKVSLSGLEHGRTSDADWDKIAQGCDEIMNMPIVIEDDPSQSLASIRAALRRVVRQHGECPLVIVDYLQLMRPVDSTVNRSEQLGEITRGLKIMSREFDTSVWAMAQVNREGAHREKPKLTDLRESGCLTGATRLWRGDTGAPIRFSELLESDWGSVPVLCVDSNRRVVSALITNVFPSGTKEVFDLRTTSGRLVTATASHKFLTLDGWRTLGDLDVGDRVAIPRSVPEPVDAGLGWSDNKLALLAYLIADGCVLSSHAIQITDDDADVLATAAEAAVEFGITARLEQGGDRCPDLYLPSPHRLARGRRNPIAQWFTEMGIMGRRSWEKKLPALIYGASNHELAVLLRHLWATDGTVAVKSATVRYDSTSRELVDGIAWCLTRLGIVGRIRVTPQGHNRPVWSVSVSGGTDILRFIGLVGGHGRTKQRTVELKDRLSDRAVNPNVGCLPKEVWSVVRKERSRVGISERSFQAAIETQYCGTTLYKRGVSRDRLLRCADALDSDLIRSYADDQVFWDEIVSIESAGVEDVYDATVEGHHNFIAEGVIAHNSIESDSDVVILLHRNDEAPNQIEVLMEKNRSGPRINSHLTLHGVWARLNQLEMNAQQWNKPD